MGLVPTGHRTRRCHGAERAERLMCESWVLPRQNSLKPPAAWAGFVSRSWCISKGPASDECFFVLPQGRDHPDGNNAARNALAGFASSRSCGVLDFHGCPVDDLVRSHAKPDLIPQQQTWFET